MKKRMMPLLTLQAARLGIAISKDMPSLETMETEPQLLDLLHSLVNGHVGKSRTVFRCVDGSAKIAFRGWLLLFRALLYR